MSMIRRSVTPEKEVEKEGREINYEIPQAQKKNSTEQMTN